MEGGQPGLGHQLGDEFHARPTVVVRVGAGDQPREGGVRPLRRQSGEFAALAVELAAGRVRGLGGDARGRESQRIVHAGVAAAVADHRGMVRQGLVQVEPVQRSSLGQLGVVVLEAADPLAGRRLAGARRHALLDLGDAAHVHVHVLELADPGAGRVGVRVDEAGGDDRVAVVEDLGAGAAERFDVAAGTDRQEAPVLHGERLRRRVGLVHGVDDAAVHDEVGGGAVRGAAGARAPAGAGSGVASAQQSGADRTRGRSQKLSSRQ